MRLRDRDGRWVAAEQPHLYALNSEPLEGNGETRSIRRRTHQTDAHYLRWCEVSQPEHLVPHAVERITNLYSGSAPRETQPEGSRVAGKRRNGPVRVLTCDDGADLLYPIDELDATLDPIRLVYTHHEPGLIVQSRVGTTDFDLDQEVACDAVMIEVSVVTDETIMGCAPEIGLRA